METEWKKPSFVEISMDAEIGSYQADGPDPDRAEEEVSSEE